MNASEKKTDMVELNCEEMERAAGGGSGESDIQKKEVPETAMEIEAGIKGKILCVFSFRVKRCQILSACSSALRSKRTT